MIEDLLAPLMFCTVFLCIFSGFPVAFSLGGVAVIFGFIGMYFEMFDLNFLQFFPQRIFAVMSNYVLLAVPFFVLMGTLLENQN